MSRAHVAEGVDQVVLQHGFMEEPQVLVGLTQGAAGKLGVDPATASSFLGAESLVVTRAPGMAVWREHLFAALSRNATPAARSFGLPPERTVTLGQQVLLQAPRDGGSTGAGDGRPGAAAAGAGRTSTGDDRPAQRRAAGHQGEHVGAGSRVSNTLVEVSELLVFFVAGFAASLVDGALGMGFGPTSASILLGGGLSPSAISTTVNLAKVATGLTAALSHWRFDNIDRRLVRRLAAPGCVGALLGVTVLASVDGDRLKPILSLLLLVMAGRILLRFSRVVGPRGEVEGGPDQPPELRGTAAVALAGGVTNGLVGAWGPVVTPFLLQRGMLPRYAIGSVNTAEVAVAVVASGSLLVSVGGGGIDVGVVAAMLLGGVLAAPLAAWSIRLLPARAMGVGVGGLLFVTNIRELMSAADVGPLRWVAYGAVAVACALAGARPHLARPRVVPPAVPPLPSP